MYKYTHAPLRHLSARATIYGVVRLEEVHVPELEMYFARRRRLDAAELVSIRPTAAPDIYLVPGVEEAVSLCDSEIGVIFGDPEVDGVDVQAVEVTTRLSHQCVCDIISVR